MSHSHYLICLDGTVAFLQSQVLLLDLLIPYSADPELHSYKEFCSPNIAPVKWPECLREQNRTWQASFLSRPSLDSVSKVADLDAPSPRNNIDISLTTTTFGAPII